MSFSNTSGGRTKIADEYGDYDKAKALAEQAKAQTSSSVAVNRGEAYARGKVDFNFFAAIVAPRVLRKLFPLFYLMLFAMLSKPGTDPEAILRFALGLPRGFAKTTFLKILVCYFILYELNHFILVVGATEPKALDFIKDVDEMLCSPSVAAIYGDWASAKSVDNAKRKIGLYKGRTIILVPMGAETSVRGMNIGHERPDLIICDDIQTREGALSEVQNESILEWFTASLLKCLPPYGADRKVIFLGNMYPGDCLLKKLKDNPEWVSLITGAILDDGESLWPELKSVAALIKEYIHDEAMGKGHLWFAEVQNDPLDGINKLLTKPLPTIFDEMTRETRPDFVFLICDPAGFRKKSDHNVISVVGVYDGTPICIGLHGGRWNPKQTVIELLSTALQTGSCLIAIESTGYQQSLLFWVDYFMKELKIEGIPVVEVTSNNKTKLSRIVDFIDEVQARTAGIVGSARSIFTYYANQYKLAKTDNRDDYLDCPAYMKQVMTKYSKLLVTREAIQKSLEDLPPVEDNLLI